MKSTFSMWGERGLVATFFADLNQLAEPETFNNFLQTVEFPESTMFSNLHPQSIHYIIEPDFANTGFGHPDAVIALEYYDSRTVIFVEAKRTDFAHACAPRSQRGQKDSKFNSKLNGQLELDYCLAMALSEYHEGADELVEPEWVLSSDYSVERKGSRRRLKKRAVLEDVVSLIGGLPSDQYYFLVITTDEQNPFPRVNVDYLPELFKPELSGPRLSFTNGWPEYRSRFGWINYVKMRAFIENIQSQLPFGSLFLQSVNINQHNMKGLSQRMVEPRKAEIQKRPNEGVSLIYASKINSHTFLHFYWRKKGCALRDYSRSDTKEPTADRRETTHVEPMIDKEISFSREDKENVTAVRFWHQKILEANDAYLKNDADR